MSLLSPLWLGDNNISTSSTSYNTKIMDVSVSAALILTIQNKSLSVITFLCFYIANGVPFSASCHFTA